MWGGWISRKMRSSFSEFTHCDWNGSEETEGGMKNLKSESRENYAQ